MNLFFYMENSSLVRRVFRLFFSTFEIVNKQWKISPRLQNMNYTIFITVYNQRFLTKTVKYATENARLDIKREINVKFVKELTFIYWL